MTPPAWVPLSLFRKRPTHRGRKDFVGSITSITKTWLTLDHGLWVKIGEPARVRLYVDGEDLLVTGADDAVLEHRTMGPSLRLTNRRYLSDLLKVGEYPGSKVETNTGLKCIRIPNCSYVHSLSTQTMDEVLASQKALAMKARESHDYLT